RWFARPGERERRALLAAHIAATVTDPLERRADLRALDRFLDHDALRERHVVARHRLLARIELALSFIGRAAAAALGHRAAKPDELMHTLFSAGKDDELLRARGEQGARWQARHVACAAPVRVLRAVQQTGATGASGAGSLGAAVRTASDAAEHPWVQGIAVELVLLLSPRFGESLVAGRLLELTRDLPRRDFLVRR